MNNLSLNKIDFSKYIDVILLISTFFTFSYLLFIHNKLYVQNLLYLIPLVISSIFITLLIISIKKSKILCYYTFMFTFISIPSFIIIDNFLKYHFNTEDKLAFFSTFNFIRSIFYYYIIKSILSFFSRYTDNIKFIKLIELSYFLFFILNLFVFYSFNFLKTNSIYMFFFKINHYSCYFFKDFPFIIAIYFSFIKINKTRSIYDYLILIASFFNILSVISQIYLVKDKKFISNMEYMMSFQIVMFSLPIFIKLTQIIFNTKKMYEIKRKEEINSLLMNLHNIKNKLEISNGKKIVNCVKDIVSTMEYLENMNDSSNSYINIKHFIDNIIDQYLYSDNNNNIDICYKSNFIIENIKINKKKLEIIINNLISNAIHHIEFGEINEIKINSNILSKKNLFNSVKYFEFIISNKGKIVNDSDIYKKGYSTKPNTNLKTGNGLYDSHCIANDLNGSLSHKQIGDIVEFKFECPISL